MARKALSWTPKSHLPSFYALRDIPKTQIFQDSKFCPNKRRPPAAEVLENVKLVRIKRTRKLKVRTHNQNEKKLKCSCSFNVKSFLTQTHNLEALRGEAFLVIFFILISREKSDNLKNKKTKHFLKSYIVRILRILF